MALIAAEANPFRVRPRRPRPVGQLVSPGAPQPSSTMDDSDSVHSTLIRLLQLRLSRPKTTETALFFHPVESLALLSKLGGSDDDNPVLSMGCVDLIINERLRARPDATHGVNGLSYLAECYVRTQSRPADAVHRQVAELVVRHATFLMDHHATFLPAEESGQKQLKRCGTHPAGGLPPAGPL